MLPDGLLDDIRAGKVGVGIAHLCMAPIRAEDYGRFPDVIGRKLGISALGVRRVVLAGQRVLARYVVEELQQGRRLG